MYIGSANVRLLQEEYFKTAMRCHVNVHKIYFWVPAGTPEFSSNATMGVAARTINSSQYLQISAPTLFNTIASRFPKKNPLSLPAVYGKLDLVPLTFISHVSTCSKAI